MAEVEVVVRDEHRNPIAGASVEIPGLEPAQMTDERGRVRFARLALAGYRVVARADGFWNERWVYVTSARPQRVRLVLPPFERTAEEARSEVVVRVGDEVPCRASTGDRGAVGVTAVSSFDWGWKGTIVLAGTGCAESRVVDGVAWFSMLPPGPYTVRLLEAGPMGEPIPIDVASGTASVVGVSVSDEQGFRYEPIGRFSVD